MGVLKISALGIIALLMGCAEGTSPKLTPIPVPPTGEVTEKPKDFSAFNPQVDILFVVDDSGSMDFAQKNLSKNAYLFAEAISKVSILDFHIGVVSTTMDYCSSVSKNGGCGYLAGKPTFVSKTSPNLVADLSQRLLLGDKSPSGKEEMFSPVMEALSNPLINGYNNGFFRPDAYLAIIFLTDAEEQSNYSSAQFLNFLTQLKGDASKVLAYGVIRTIANKNVCKSSEPLTDPSLEDFLSEVSNGDKTQKNILDLCSPNYGKKLAEFAEDIVRRSAGRVRLTKVPNAKTIRVTYGYQTIPNDAIKGWVYEPSSNSIILSKNIDWDYQNGTASLLVDFEVIDVTYPDKK